MSTNRCGAGPGCSARSRRRTGLKSWAISIGVLTLSTAADAAVHVYTNEQFSNVSDARVFKAGYEGMFRSRRHPQGSVVTPRQQGTNDGKSFIKASDLSFRRPADSVLEFAEDEGFTGLIEIVVFEQSQQDLIGYPAEDGWKYCCDNEWAKKTKCQPDRVYIADDLPQLPAAGPAGIFTLAASDSSVLQGSVGSTTRRLVDVPVLQGSVRGTTRRLAEDGGVATANVSEAGFPWRIEVDFLNDELRTHAILEDTVDISVSGVYSMWFVICDSSMPEISVHGTSIWKNPKGYLPGATQPLLPFHAAISLLFILLSGTWLALHLLNPRHIAAPQHLVTVCVLLGMVESCMDYADVYSVNSSGFISPALSSAAALVASLFRASVRVTVVLLARGHGTFRPFSVDRDCYVFAALYTVTSFAREMHHIRDDLVQPARLDAQLAYLLPVATLDMAFVFYVFRALHTSRRQLHGKGSTFRLNVYRCFTACMVIITAVCIGYAAYEAQSHAVRPQFERWRFEWMHQTFWHLVHFAVVALLCLIWAPSELLLLFNDPQDTSLRNAALDDDQFISLSRLSLDGQLGKWD